MSALVWFIVVYIQWQCSGPEVVAMRNTAIALRYATTTLEGLQRQEVNVCSKLLQAT